MIILPNKKYFQHKHMYLKASKPSTGIKISWNFFAEKWGWGCGSCSGPLSNKSWLPSSKSKSTGTLRIRPYWNMIKFNISLQIYVTCLLFQTLVTLLYFGVYYLFGQALSHMIYWSVSWFVTAGHIMIIVALLVNLSQSICFYSMSQGKQCSCVQTSVNKLADFK